MRAILFICFFGMALFAKAQEQTDLNTYMYSRQFINSASIAANDVLNGALIYKSQWVGLDGAPVSQYFNVNGTPFMTMDVHKVGLTVFNDRIGLNNTTDISFDYAFKGKIGYKNFFSLSLSPMLVLRSNDFNNIQLDFEGDPLFLGSSQNFTGANARVGFYYQNQDLFLGGSIPKLLANEIETENGQYVLRSTFDISQLAIIGHGGYNWRLNNYFTFTPSFLLKYETGQPLRIDLNGIFDYQERFGGGISYRTLRNVSAVLYAQLNEQFRFAYAYNYNFGRIREFNSGSHEVQLIFGLFNRKINVVNMPKLLQEYKEELDKKIEKESKEKQNVKRPEGVDVLLGTPENAPSDSTVTPEVKIPEQEGKKKKSKSNKESERTKQPYQQ